MIAARAAAARAGAEKGQVRESREQPPPQRSRRRTAAINLAVLLAVTLASLLVAELALRVYAHVRWVAALDRLGLKADTMSYVGSDTPGLYWHIRPYLNGANSHGYFDVEHEYAKPEGTFRIVVIGDSVVAGQGVGWKQAFSRLLEAGLDERYPERRWEVIMLACSGYSTSQELVLLESEAFLYSPDLVLWSYVLNDPADPVFGRSAGDLWKGYRPPSELLHVIRRAWFAVREAIAARHAPREWHERIHAIHWDQVKRNIGRIGADCHEHGVPAVFVINPVLGRGPSFDDYPLRGLHERLAEVARESGLTVLDLLDAYRGRDPRALGFDRDPWHPNVEGHRLIARYLLEALAERSLIPTAAAPR